MITKIALHKAKILTFWDKHGLVATLDAFKIKRKRSWSPEVIEEIKRLHLTHYHTYPRTPKMNAHCERFNRTVQDEFVDYHLDEMIEPDVFNQKLNLIEKVV